MSHYLVDGNNVVGAKPDGWWRDKPAATDRLVRLISDWADGRNDQFTVVFDGAPITAMLATAPTNLEVVFAGRHQSADDEIARLANADPDPAGLVVVTSDAGLAARLPHGATVVGAGSFRRRLDG